MRSSVNTLQQSVIRMKKMNTWYRWYLKGFLVLLTVVIVGVSLMLLFSLLEEPVNPRYAGLLYPLIGGLYLSILPVIYLLQLMLSLLKERVDEVGKNRQRVWRKARAAAMVFSMIFVLMLPFTYRLADYDDAPGLILFFSLPILFGGAAYALFSLFLEKEQEHS